MFNTIIRVEGVDGELICRPFQYVDDGLRSDWSCHWTIRFDDLTRMVCVAVRPSLLLGLWPGNDIGKTWHMGRRSIILWHCLVDLLTRVCALTPWHRIK